MGVAPLAGRFSVFYALAGLAAWFWLVRAGGLFEFDDELVEVEAEVVVEGWGDAVAADEFADGFVERERRLRLGGERGGFLAGGGLERGGVVKQSGGIEKHGYAEGMEVMQAYRFKARPSRAQAAFFNRTAGTCRLLYNLALEQRQRAYRQRRKSLRYVEQAAELKALKAEFPFFAEAPHHCLQAVLRNLDGAFVRFFQGKAGYPRFKKKGTHDSFTYPDKAQITFDPAKGKKGRRGRLKLPKAGWVTIVQHRAIKGELRNVTVTREADGWYVSILTAREVEDPQPVAGLPVGVDLGVTNAATLSTGERFDVPSFTSGERERLHRLQRKSARQVRGSRSRARTKRQIALLHQRVARRRQDALHKLSYHLAKNHLLVVFEGLKVKNMTRSAKGTTAAPGRNVRQKAGLNRAILETGWGELRRQVQYKAPWMGSRYLAITDYAFTSQECSACGHTAAANRTSQAAFACLSCGSADNADVNAARNILARGLRVTAGGALDSGRATKPELRSNAA